MTHGEQEAIRLRPFAVNDQAAARRLILAGLGDHFGVIDEMLNPDLDDIQRHYVASGHLFVVAERDGDLIGTGALIEEAPSTGRIVRMSVDRNCRGQGLGRRLVAHLIAAARARGYTRLLVETNDDWSDAIGLYRACSFVEEARRDGEIHMVMELR
jgi:ribosomal protein S18 acetylase RimI-like enzyme